MKRHLTITATSPSPLPYLKVRDEMDKKPLVLFSGDLLGPSLISSITKGSHMTKVRVTVKIRVQARARVMIRVRVRVSVRLG